MNENAVVSSILGSSTLVVSGDQQTADQLQCWLQHEAGCRAEQTDSYHDAEQRLRRGAAQSVFVDLREGGAVHCPKPLLQHLADRNGNRISKQDDDPAPYVGLRFVGGF